MSVRLKILLVVTAMCALFVAQAVFFAFQQERLSTLGHEGWMWVLALSDPSALSSGARTQATGDSLDHVSAFVKEGYSGMFAALFCALILGIAGVFALTRSIVPVLSQAIKISNDIAIGFLENKIDTTVKGETGDLLRALASLQQSRAELNEHLERQIRETETAYYDMQRSSAALNVANASLASLNASMKTMLNALDQGLFSFGPDGVCSDVASEACVDLLGARPCGKSMIDVLRISDDDKECVQGILRMAFADKKPSLGIPGLLELLPTEFIRDEKTKIALTYHAIYDENGKVRSILVVATDHTAEEEALKLMRDHEVEALRILRLSSNQNLFIQFYRSVTDFFMSAEKPLHYEIPLDRLRRDIHTFKGNASIFHLQDIQDVLHDIENALEPISEDEKAWGVVRVAIPKLQAVLTKVHQQAGDIFGMDFDRRGVMRVLPLTTLSAVAERLKAQSVDAGAYKLYVETLMGEPVRKRLASIDMGLQELADRYGKRVSPCYYTGDNFPLLTEKYEDLFASLAHIARNIISHAIDEPDVRAKQNKVPELTVIIDTQKYKIGSQEWFRLSVEDDGCGIDVAHLREKIAGSRTADVVGRMTDMQVMMCIFEDTISTKEDVDELAGRGVGLSAVKYEAEKLGGRVRVESERGVYTRIIVEAPVIW